MVITRFVIRNSYVPFLEFLYIFFTNNWIQLTMWKFLNMIVIILYATQLFTSYLKFIFILIVLVTIFYKNGNVIFHVFKFVLLGPSIMHTEVVRTRNCVHLILKFCYVDFFITGQDKYVYGAWAQQTENDPLPFLSI